MFYWDWTWDFSGVFIVTDFNRTGHAVHSFVFFFSLSLPFPLFFRLLKVPSLYFFILITECQELFTETDTFYTQFPDVRLRVYTYGPELFIFFADDPESQEDEPIEIDHVTSTSNETLLGSSRAMEESIPSPSTNSTHSGNVDLMCSC